MRVLITALAVALTAAATAAAQEAPTILAVPDAPRELSLTIHNGGTAMVRDRRPVTLRPGANRLVFDAIADTIVPESVVLRPAGVAAPLPVVESVFRPGRLTPRNLLAESVGDAVWVARTNPATGEVERRRGRLLAFEDGIVVEVDGRIEMVPPEAVAVDAVPAGLQAAPALSITVEAGAAAVRAVELAYLAGGLDWRADYVLELRPGADADLRAQVTVTNETDTSWPDARLSFAAGEVNRVEPPPPPPPRPAAMAMRAIAESAPAKDLEPEAMAAAHLYRLDRPTDLGARQTKQIALLSRAGVPVEREYVARAPSFGFHGRVPQPQESNAALELVLRNTDQARLGVPLPAGVVRVYRRDSAGELQFQGEDRIGHTAAGGEVRLTVGRDFDLPVERRQTAFERIGQSAHESAYEVELRNAKPEPVTVLVEERMPGDWTVVEESLPHDKKTAQTAVWAVPVPAGGTATLRYRVRVEGF